MSVAARADRLTSSVQSDKSSVIIPRPLPFHSLCIHIVELPWSPLFPFEFSRCRLGAPACCVPPPSNHITAYVPEYFSSSASRPLPTAGRCGILFYRHSIRLTVTALTAAEVTAAGVMGVHFLSRSIYLTVDLG